ncbi:MAG: TRAP transporter small permease subunit [Dehalococcoidales bacterium]|nr:TRAP transporter small permease subunit [Dehalococcoidales bacterium]
MDIFSRFAWIIDRISEWMGKFFSVSIYALMLIVSYEVVMRYVFNAPTRWAHESSGFLLTIAVLMGMANTHRLRGHINVDVLLSRFSPRTATIIGLVTVPLFFFFCVVMLLKTWDFATLSLSRLQHSDTTWAPPLYPFKLLMPIGFSMLILQGISNVIHDIKKIRTGKE